MQLKEIREWSTFAFTVLLIPLLGLCGTLISQKIDLSADKVSDQVQKGYVDKETFKNTVSAINATDDKQWTSLKANSDRLNQHDIEIQELKDQSRESTSAMAIATNTDHE
jgi:hypothetical protein